MKRIFLTKILTLVVVTVCCTGTLRAQEITVLNGYPPLNTNIVRQFLPNLDIHYCEDATNHYFLLCDASNPNTVIMASFPSFLYIRDFEVFDGMVYFCGNFPNGGNPWGFVGQIKVVDLFYYNGSYNIGILNYTMLDTVYYITSVTHMASCDRMDVFKDINRDIVHLAVVGEVAHGSTYSPPLRKTVGDFWYDGSYWRGKALYQKLDYYKTSDVTCTDNYVVVSGYDDDCNYSILVIFDQIQGFPAFPIFSNTIHIKDRRYRDDIILVERMNRDDVGVTHYFEDLSLGTFGTAFHYINDVASLPSPLSHFSLHYVHGNHPPISILRDLRYNESYGDSSLFLLHDIDSPLWSAPKSTLFEIFGYNLPLMTMNVWYTNEDVSLLSVDNRVAGPFFSLGGNHNYTMNPLMTKRITQELLCYENIEQEYEDVSSQVSFYLGDYDDGLIDFHIPANRFYLPNPMEKVISTKCERILK